MGSQHADILSPSHDLWVGGHVAREVITSTPYILDKRPSLQERSL
jgi:hypothetical protein